MLRWLFLGLVVVSIALAVYCLRVSRDAAKVVTAVNGPPLLQEPVDFSRPFTNEFAFRHTVQPFYGTMYLTFKADPWPKTWENSEISSEDLRGAKGEMRVMSTNGAMIDRLALDWTDWHFHDRESKAAPFQGFFGRLPLGDYRLIIATTEGVSQLNTTKQQLILRYDYIHEASIAKGLRIFGLVFGIAACVFGGALIWQVKRVQGHSILQGSSRIEV